jgi:hypothetical protein
MNKFAYRLGQAVGILLLTAVLILICLADNI